MGRIHLAEDLIVRHLAIERANQASKTFLANRGENVCLVHTFRSTPRQQGAVAGRTPAQSACGRLDTTGTAERCSRGARISSVFSAPQEIRIASALGALFQTL